MASGILFVLVKVEPLSGGAFRESQIASASTKYTAKGEGELDPFSWNQGTRKLKSRLIQANTALEPEQYFTRSVSAIKTGCCSHARQNVAECTSMQVL